MIVCHCAGVSDATIAELVRAGASTLRDIVQQTGAGRCCGPCREEIRALMVTTAGNTAGPAPIVD